MGLTANPAKCNLAVGEVTCLGYHIRGSLVKLVVNKIQVLTSCHIPQTKRQVKRFLGLAGYYQRFIPVFASVAAPLTDLIKDNNSKKI